MSGCRNNLYFQISIHAPCEGCDLLCLYLALGVTLFQSTHPVKGATIISMVNIVYRLISIHAPCEGCDDSKGIKGFGEICISIHAPCEGCDFHFFIIHLACDISIHAPCEGCDFIEKTLLKLSPPFQSTHPVKGATINACNLPPNHHQFQSTHPVKGATANFNKKLNICVIFYNNLTIFIDKLLFVFTYK